MSSDVLGIVQITEKEDEKNTCMKLTDFGKGLSTNVTHSGYDYFKKGCVENLEETESPMDG